MAEHTLFPSIIPDDAEDEPASGPELNPPPGSMTVDELRDRISDTTHEPLLEAMREAEADGENRSSALDAIDSRLQTIRED